MCSSSVMPMPSRMSTPKCDVHRWYSAAGSASPAEAASRTPARASAGSPARSMLEKKVGPAKNRVAAYFPARSAIISGRAGLGSSTAAAPADIGNSTEFPRP